MKFLKTLPGKVLAIFLSFTLGFIGFILIFFPSFGIKIFEIQSAFFISLNIFFVLCAGLLLYFFAKKFNNQLQKEKNNTAEIINRYDALSTATNDAVWDHDLITGETFYNQRLMQIFGYNKEDLKDNTNWWDNNIHSDDKERVQNKINSILLEQGENQLWHDEYQFRCKDGSYKIVYDRSFIVRDANGKALRLIGAMNDITEARRLEQKVVQEKLDNKNSLGKAIIEAQEEERKIIREELHDDVNQILAGIKLCMHQINSQPEVDEAVKLTLEQLDDAINKIRKISNQLAPSALEFFGLVASIKDVIHFNETHYPVNIKLNTELFNEVKIDNPTRVFIYRIIQDILLNIFAGPKPTVIYIELKNNIGTKIQITLTDNSEATDDINALIKQRHLNDIKNKLEMYNGQMHIAINEVKTIVLEISL
jgi:two-component system, NarL family, sensor histidine kinase UhpB